MPASERDSAVLPVVARVLSDGRVVWTSVPPRAPLSVPAALLPLLDVPPVPDVAPVELCRAARGAAGGGTRRAAAPPPAEGRLRHLDRACQVAGEGRTRRSTGRSRSPGPHGLDNVSSSSVSFQVAGERTREGASSDPNDSPCPGRHDESGGVAPALWECARAEGWTAFSARQRAPARARTAPQWDAVRNATRIVGQGTKRAPAMLTSVARRSRSSA